MNSYTKLLSKIASLYLSQPDSIEWKKLYNHVDQKILDNAYSYTNKIIELYHPLKLQPRKSKNYERVKNKNKESKQYSKDFKVNCDFLAFRICVDEPYNIKDTIDKIIKITEKNNGIFHIRNSIIDKNGNLIDIIQYVYVYLPDVGYIIEFQIGHPFAMYVFTSDSLIRDGNSDVVDLWENNFYNNVVKLILNKENKDFNMLKELKILYGEKEIPVELLDILNKI